MNYPKMTIGGFTPNLTHLNLMVDKINYIGVELYDLRGVGRSKDYTEVIKMLYPDCPDFRLDDGKYFLKNSYVVKILAVHMDNGEVVLLLGDSVGSEVLDFNSDCKFKLPVLDNIKK